MTDSPEWCGVRYFGPPELRKPDETQIEVPIGQLCILCQEPVASGDIGTINFVEQVTHYECDLRSVVGSVGHLNETCSCYGGTEEDPPGMTRRQAAIAASELFREQRMRAWLWANQS